VLTNLGRHNIFKEGNETCCLALVGEIEIHTIPKHFDAQTTTMGTVLENELFQVQKCTFMGHALTNLNEGPPGSLSKLGLALKALLIPDDENYSEGLLKDGTLLDLFLNGHTDLESHRVGFRPDPAGVY
jgi:hypothetical protein